MTTDRPPVAPSLQAWDPCRRSHIVRQAANCYVLVWDGQEVDQYWSLAAAKAAATRRRSGRRK